MAAPESSLALTVEFQGNVAALYLKLEASTGRYELDRRCACYILRPMGAVRGQIVSVEQELGIMS